MKPMANQRVHPGALAAAVALFSVVVLSSASPSGAAMPGPGGAAAGRASKSERVEMRIKELHTKLSITPAQEELWNSVTQVMRDNAKTMEALIKARSENTKTMTAVEDFKSYGEIAEAHADGLKKFIPVFEPLYASMSDAQKKNADTLFHRHGRANARARHK